MLIFGYDPLWGYEGLFQTAFGSIKILVKFSVQWDH